MESSAGFTKRRNWATGGRTASSWPSWPGSHSPLAKSPLLDTPESALNRAFGWAAGRAAAAVRADFGGGFPDWDASDFGHLVEEARAFRRVGGPALPDPEAFLGEIVAGLFGVQADAGGGRFVVSPWLPEGWRSMALRRLRCHRTIVDIEVRPRAEWAVVRINRTFGPPIAVALSVRNAGIVGRVTVDEIALQGDRAVFTVQGEHEAMFFFERTAP